MNTPEKPPLAGKRVLVTGSSKGIGRATAQLLAEQGARVFVTARDAAALEAVLADLTGKGHAYLAGELTDEAFVGRLFETISRDWGGLDMLVNNAGICKIAPVEELAVADLRHTLEVNVVAVFHCMQLAVRLMRPQGEGKILNVGSVRSHWTEGGDGGAYNASKYALRGMTESVARQLHGQGCNIAVGLICPGIVDTTLTNPAREAHPDWLSPEDVARAILHALSAPAGVNVFDTILFPTAQKPW